MKHNYECHSPIQKYALKDFNESRKDIEEMFESKIKVLRMFWKFNWIVEFELIESVE